MDSNIEDRLAEIEQRQTRFVLAGEGTERQFEQGVLAEVVASLQRDFEATAKRVVKEAMAQRVRGTFDPKEKYLLNDVVACNGASFLARRDDPGDCPNANWQMIAAQGKRGIAGPKGDPAPRISGWRVNPENFSIQPILSDGSFAPALELRPLFQQFNDETAP
jgi:hypothetical protein